MNRRTFLALAGAALVFGAVGCGGSGAFGRNSDVVVRLESFNGSNMNDFGLSISPNEGEPNSRQAATDTQGQNWVIRDFSSSLIRFSFTTTSQRVPYFLYVKNRVGTNGIRARLRITVDGTEQISTVIIPPQNGTWVQYATVFRNNVQD